MKNLLIFLGLVYLSLAPSGARAQDFYGPSQIQTIEITFAQTNWDYCLDTAKAGAESFLMGSVKINGTAYDSVGVKYKGNSSYNATYKKNPLHIELNTFKNQNHGAYTDIKLSNGYGDPSLIREVLAYTLAGSYMDCPQASLAKVYVNGVYLGLYSSAESINNAFGKRKFYNTEEVFVKCNPMITPGPAVKSNLVYKGDDTAAYTDYYEMKTASGWQDLLQVCKQVSQYDSVSKVMEMESTLWMLAFNNLFVNLDSYTGAFAQNYYLWKDANGYYRPLLWDLNMCFGSFPFAGSPGNGMGSLNVAGMTQLLASYHSTHTDWPLLYRILSNTETRKRYMAHYRTLLEECIDSGLADTLATRLQTLATPWALADTNKFFNDSLFQIALTSNISNGSYQIPGILSLLHGRSSWLKTQADFQYQVPVLSKATAKDLRKQQQQFVVSVRAENATEVKAFYRFTREAVYTELILKDDGLAGDSAAGDAIFSASIAATGNHLQYYFYAANAQAGTYLPAAAPHQYLQAGMMPVAITPGKLLINELLADNKVSDINDYGIYTDWIELINISDDTLDLFGTTLSDDIVWSNKYAFGAGTIMPPHSMLAVWADHLSSNRRYLHSNFTLSASGDELYLVNSQGVFLDSVVFGAQLPDVSLGRCKDGTGKMIALSKPTFMGLNSTFCISGTQNISANNVLKVYPNPAMEALHVYNPLETCSYILINASGQILRQGILNQGNNTLELEQLPAGIYMLVPKAMLGAVKIIKQ